MLDKKTTAILKVLGKLGEDSAYKVITVNEIFTALPSKSQYDSDSIKQTIEYLCKQEFIVLKFEEDETFCYSLLPKARIYLEQDMSKDKVKKQHLPFSWIIICTFGCAIGAFLSNFLFYYLFG